MKTLPDFIECFNNDPICSKTAPKIRPFFPLFLISYVCITCLSIRSQWDWENSLDNLRVFSKKYFFSSESLKTCDSIASNSLEMNFIFLKIYQSKCKNEAKYFTQTLLLSGDINLNPRPTHNSQIDGLRKFAWLKWITFFRGKCKLFFIKT